MAVRGFVVALAGVLIAMGLAVPAANAATSRDGFGLFVADDDWNFNDANYLIPSLGDDFGKLAPEVFRLQTIWNTMDRPEWQARTHAMIDRARAKGVQEVILTVRSNNPGNVGPEGYFPTSTQYNTKVTALVQAFASKVDVWGPANEPNGAWRPADAPGGQQQLPPVYAAAYFLRMRDAVAVHDPTALVTSADFLDDWGTLTQFNQYLTDYANATSGDWGDVVAFHPYRDVELGQLTYTNALASKASGKDIWVTEVGAHFLGDPLGQNARVAWIANTLAGHARVKRIAYYNMRGGGSNWDTGLLNADFTRRPAWYTWCAAAHGDNPTDPDCLAPSPPVDTPVVGDWNGNATDTPGVFNAGEWCMSNSSSPSICDIRINAWGQATDKPVSGDWDANGTDTVGVFNSGQWCLSNASSPSSCNVHIQGWGQTSDTPVVGDWDGNGADTIGVYNSGEWCLSNNPTAPTVCDLDIQSWGQASDTPVIGDWDGNGTDTIGVYNSGEWCLSNSPTNPTVCDIRIHAWGS